MKTPFVLLIVIPILTLSACTKKVDIAVEKANVNDEWISQHINKVKNHIENNEFGKAKEILDKDFNKYVKAYYDKNKAPSATFYELENISLYSGLLYFLEDDYKNGGKYIYAAIGIKNPLWNMSWYDLFDNFIKENERIFSKKNDLMKSKLYYMISVVYQIVEDKNNGIKYLKKAYSLNPENFEITIDLARLYFSISEIIKSKEYFLKAVKLNPHDAQALSDASMVLNITGEHKNALEMSEKAVKIDPNNLKARINCAIMLYTNNRSSEAEEFNRETINKFPNNKDYLQRASLYFLLDQQKYKEAYEIVKNFEESELHENNVFTALAALTYSFNSDENKAKSILKRLVADYSVCKKDEFLKNNWSFRRDIYKKFKELINE